MKKFNYRQEFGITTEDGTPVQEMGVTLSIREEGMGVEKIVAVVSEMAKDFAALMVNECNTIKIEGNTERGE